MTSDEAISVAKQIGALGYFETSAKENQGVYELFSEAARIAFVVPKSWIQLQLLGDNAEKDKDSDLKIHTLRTNTDWRHIITQANNLLLSGTDLRSSSLRDLLITSFNTPQLKDAVGHVEGIQQDIVIMILSHLFPRLSRKLKEISRIPLESFINSEDILNFLEAVIKSGLTADIERGVVFVLGNTGVGKTSLANTLKQFIDNPNQIPMPLLAGEHPDLLETEILEVYDEVSLEHDKELSVVLTKIGEKASLIELSDENAKLSKTGMKMKKLNLKLVDMGGHQEQSSS